MSIKEIENRLAKNISLEERTKLFNQLIKLRKYA